MRLARPDVFHPRIVLAGCPRYPAGDGDDDGLVAALRRRGLHARWLSWDASEVADAQLVILRATRDYPGRLAEFLAWTRSVQNLLNPPAVVAWNADHCYLDDLANRDVPTLPAEWYPPGQPVRLPRAGPVFLSADVGTGTRRFSDDATAAAWLAELHAAGRTVVVQHAGPADETVLVFLGGKPSHAFTTQHGAVRQGEADFALWEVGAAALTAAATHIGVDAGELLYARAHLVGAQVLELQLVDPALGWRRLDADARGRAQREFALAVESALGRLGLGPLSHRDL